MVDSVQISWSEPPRLAFLDIYPVTCHSEARPEESLFTIPVEAERQKAFHRPHVGVQAPTLNREMATVGGRYGLRRGRSTQPRSERPVPRGDVSFLLPQDVRIASHIHVQQSCARLRRSKQQNPFHRQPNSRSTGCSNPSRISPVGPVRPKEERGFVLLST